MKYSTRDLVEMLTYQRGSGSRMEQIFIRKYLDSVRGIKSDNYGNRYIIIGNPDTLLLAHTDTVHPFNSKRQKVFVHNNQASTDGTSVLGADNGTGVWILLNLIHNRTPGHYIFQRQEEHGGTGSSHSARKKRPHIKKAISFDRKGYSDIITHQHGRRMCSDTFATALAKKIGGGYRPSRGGIFTDSANYADVVPECTNISIGYEYAHTPDETQDLYHANWLMRRLLTINFNALPAERDPREPYRSTYGTPWHEISFNMNDSWLSKPKKNNWWTKK